MLFEGKVTTDRNVIKGWVEARHGWPAALRAAGGAGKDFILRIGFPDGEDSAPLVPIPWEQFFEEFDRNQLAFLYEEFTKNGTLSKSFGFL